MAVDPDRLKYTLDEDQIPRSWYNLAADLPVPLAPPLHPGHQAADRAGRPGTRCSRWR